MRPWWSTAIIYFSFLLSLYGLYHKTVERTIWDKITAKIGDQSQELKIENDTSADVKLSNSEDAAGTINTKNPDKIFVCTGKLGCMKSTDNGETWVNIGHEKKPNE